MLIELTGVYSVYGVRNRLLEDRNRNAFPAVWFIYSIVFSSYAVCRV